MPTLVLHDPLLSGTVGPVLFLRSAAAGTLLNAGGDVLVETGSTGVFSAVIAEPITETYSCRYYEAAAETPATAMGNGWIGSGETTIRDAYPTAVAVSVTVPELMVSTTIATLTSQTSFTLAAGSADNDAYNDCMAVITDAVTAVQKAKVTILDYVGATKTVTLSSAGVFTVEVGDTIAIVAVVAVVEGGTFAESVVVARVPVGGTEGWPKEFIIGDARLTSLNTAPKLFVKDIDDNVLAALGTKNFSDADFHAKLRFSPLTDGTRDLDQPPATIEITEADSPGIVFNGATVGAEYFALQITKAKADLGVIKTEYNCQFIMNWGATTVYESTINLGTIKFIRKNAAVV